jgi:hypothetical protein
MAITHTTAVRVVLGDTLWGTAGQLGSGAKLKLYNGTPPANAQAALSGNTLLATITGISFGANASGVSTITASTADAAATGGSGASFFRLTKSDDTVHSQGTIGTSAADFIINSTTVAAGANVSLTGTNTMTSPP